MKLLITGGSGFIGAQLAHQARGQHEIVVTGLANTDAERQRLSELESAGIVVELGRLQDADFTRRLVRGCDGVIHLAAAQHEANVPDDYFREVNVDATRLLLHESWRAGVRRFVYGSTIGVYGSSVTTLIDEDTPPRPENIYARTKLEAEECVRAYADRIATTIVRISETYGPGDMRLLKLFRAIDRGLFVMIGAGENQRQLLHVHDLVRGLLLALEHPAAVGQTFVFAGPAPMTTRCMVEQIAAALRRSPRTWRVPLWPFELAALAMEKLLKPLKIQPPLHRRRLDFFRTSFSFSTAQAKAKLGFEAVVPFSSGARDAVAWYRNHGLLPPRGTVEPNGLEAKEHSVIATDEDVPLAAFDAKKGWQYSDILEFTHDAIIIWEMDGAGILYWNRAAAQLYGYGREEALGRTTHLLFKTRLEGGVNHLESSLTRYGIWVGTLHHRRRDDVPIVVQARLALMSQRNGRWLVLEVNRDVTALPRDDKDAQNRMQTHLLSLRSQGD